MRPTLDAKTPNALCVQEAPFSYAMDAPKVNAVDHFIVPQERTARLLSESFAPRFQTGQPRIWWKDLQGLIDALPLQLVFANVPELDEKSKEALRVLARSAPHRTVTL
jgi:hypothetical protein